MIFQNKPQNKKTPKPLGAPPLGPGRRTTQSRGRVKKMANEKKFLDPDPLLATQTFKS